MRWIAVKAIDLSYKIYINHKREDGENETETFLRQRFEGFWKKIRTIPFI